MITSNHMKTMPASWRGWQIDLNPVGMSIFLGASMGVVIIGGGMRAAMRMVALMVGMPPAFSLSGTAMILLMGLMIGTLLGLLYTPLARWMPWHWAINGTLLSLPLTFLITCTFMGLFGPIDGEAALVGPWLGAALFALPPFLYSCALSYAQHRLEPRLARALPRRVSTLWFGVYLVALAWAIVNMMGLLEPTRTPEAVRRMLARAGVAFQDVRDVQTVLGLCFVFTYCGLHLAAFWAGGHRLAARLMLIGHLALAALLIGGLPLGPSLVNTSAGSVREWLMWGGCLVLILVGIFWSRKYAWGREMWLGIAIFSGSFLVMWLAILLLPSLQLRQWTGLQTALTVTSYWWPWLLLPTVLIRQLAWQQRPSDEE